MRFLIPTFPFFAVGGAWLLSVLAKNFGVAGRVAVGVVAALQLLITGASSEQMLDRSKTSLTAAARARATAEKQIPAGSVVILDRTLAESLDAVGHWKIIEENFVGGMGPRGGGPGMGMGMGKRPMGPGGGPMEADGSRPSPQQVGKNHAQQERYAGLSMSERRTQVWADMAKWAGDKPVYWFARSLDSVENALPTGANYESLAEIEAPAMGFGPQGGGPGGPGMGPGGGGRGGFAGGGRGGAGMRGGRFDPMQKGGPRGGMSFGPPGADGFAGEDANVGSKLRLVKINFGKT
jgi:hypothetical protein